MVRFFKSKKQQDEPEEDQEQEEQDEEEIEEERKPVKRIAMKEKQPMKVVEQEITLSLLNNKLNYIITKLEEFGKE
jgi:hypothetical protein